MRSIAVIGLGRFGAALARELASRGVEVLGIDRSEAGQRAVDGHVAQFLAIDARDARALEAAGVADLDHVVVSIGEDFEAAQECVLALKGLGVDKIIARAQTEDRRRILSKIGADHVISPEEESAKRVAHNLTHPLVNEAVDIGDGIEVATLEVPETFTGKTLGEAALSSTFGILVLRLARRDAEGARLQVIVPPTAATEMRAGDEVTVVGNSDGVARFARA